MQLWTKEHAVTLIPAIVVMLLLGWLCRKTLGNKSLKIRMIPIQIIAVLLLLLEVGKQGVSLYRGYDLYCLPFHFCSLYLFTLPALAFYRGKHQHIVATINAAITTALFLIMLIYPNLIYSASDVTGFFGEYISFHTVVFHNLVMLACVLIPALKLYSPAPKGETKAVALFIVCVCAVSSTMAQLLQTNFNNFYSCNIPPLEQLRLSLQGALGYGLTQLLYVLIVSLLDLLVVLLCWRIIRIIAKKTHP